MRLVLPLLATLLLAACATPYQARQDKPMGYYEHGRGEGRYEVFFNAERHTDWGTIDAYLERRATELAAQQKAKGYRVLKREHQVMEQYADNRVQHDFNTGKTPLADATQAHIENHYQIPFSYRQGRLDIQLKSPQ